MDGGVARVVVAASGGRSLARISPSPAALAWARVGEKCGTVGEMQDLCRWGAGIGDWGFGLGLGLEALARDCYRLLPMARSPRGVTFFACAKKVTKESTPLAACPSLREGSAIVPGISGRGILPLPETAHILVRRPSGFTRPACHALKGAREAKARAGQQQQRSIKNRCVRNALALALALLLLLLFGAPSAAVATVGKPAGRRTRMCGVLGRHRMCRPKIPTGDTDPSRFAAGARGPGCAFFAYFLCTSKESEASRRAHHRRRPTAMARSSAQRKKPIPNPESRIPNPQ